MTSVNYDPLTPVRFLERSAGVFAENTAVVHGDIRRTYAEFYGRVRRLAAALADAGIEKGDKVAFISPNTPAMLEAHFAVPMIGAALVCVNIRLSPGEVGYIINHSDARIVFVDNEFADRLEP
ncbi:MAG: AMP-binding protein, partial [Thermodesulfobacteriota bacterium]